MILALALCTAAPRTDCVVDGDTFWRNGEKVRIAEIDAPETEQARCPSERAAGERAKLRLLELLNAGPVVVTRVGTDRYKRTLANVTVNGRDVGRQMIAGGYARAYQGGRRPWC